MEENPRKTRRFQFSLRTIFAFMTVVAVLVAVSAQVKKYVVQKRDEESRQKMLEGARENWTFTPP